MGGLETGFKLSAGTAGPAKNKGDCDVRSFIPRSRPRRKFEGILAREARSAIKTAICNLRLEARLPRHFESEPFCAKLSCPTPKGNCQLHAK